MLTDSPYQLINRNNIYMIVIFIHTHKPYQTHDQKNS